MVYESPPGRSQGEPAPPGMYGPGQYPFPSGDLPASFPFTPQAYGQSGFSHPVYAGNPPNDSSSPRFPTTGNLPGTAFSSFTYNMPGEGAPASYRRPDPPPRKRGIDPRQLIGIILLLVIVVAGGAAEYIYLTSRNEHSAGSSSVRPTPTPSTPPLFSDSFTNNANAWNLQSQNGQFAVSLGNGSLTLEDDNNKLLWELLPGSRTYSNFRLVVDARLSKGDQNNGYGIYLRGTSNADSDLASYYRFELYGDGSYAIFKGNIDASGNSIATTLVNYTLDPAIRKQGDVNHIVIVAKGATMTFMVNGQTLKTLSDPSYASGSIALFVSNLQGSKPGAQAMFSNLAIYPA